MIRSLLLVLPLCVAAAASTLANTITFFGNTSGMPVFNRPTETGARSGFGTAVPFFVYQLDVVTGGLFNFSLDAANPSNYDTFLHLYTGSFNPADTSDPALNFLAGNDDRSRSTTNSGLAFALNSATRYFFVVDGFSNVDFGAYTATISSASGFTGAAPVPESGSTFALVTLALGGVAVVRYRVRNGSVGC